MASKQSEGKHPSQRWYPPELKGRAVRMAQDGIAEQPGRQTGVIAQSGAQLPPTTHLSLAARYTAKMHSRLEDLSDGLSELLTGSQLGVGGPQ